MPRGTCIAKTATAAVHVWWQMSRFVVTVITDKCHGRCNRHLVIDSGRLCVQQLCMAGSYILTELPLSGNFSASVCLQIWCIVLNLAVDAREVSSQ